VPAGMPARGTGVAVLGDSFSDEYQGDDRRGGAFAATTRNWVELLARFRGVDFGPWGTWCDGRRTGYAYDWAYSGETAEEMLARGQPWSVAQQIARGYVSKVVIYIGGNDFD